MPSLQWPESAQLSMPAEVGLEAIYTEGSCGRATAAQEGRVYMQVAIVDNTGGTKACGLVLQSRHIWKELSQFHWGCIHFSCACNVCKDKSPWVHNFSMYSLGVRLCIISTVPSALYATQTVSLIPAHNGSRFLLSCLYTNFQRVQVP